VAKPPDFLLAVLPSLIDPTACFKTDCDWTGAVFQRRRLLISHSISPRLLSHPFHTSAASHRLSLYPLGLASRRTLLRCERWPAKGMTAQRRHDFWLCGGWTELSPLHGRTMYGRCTYPTADAVRLIVRSLYAFRHALVFAFAKGLVSYPFFPFTSHACALVYFHKSPFSQHQPFEVIPSYSKLGGSSWPGTSDLFE
jgi:hypothetical protein